MWPVTIERQPLSAKTNTPRCRLSRSTTVLQRTLYTSTHPWKRQHAVRLLCRHTYICVESPPTLHSTSNLIAFSIQASGCFCLPSCRAFRASLQSYTSDRTTIPLHLWRPNRTSDPNRKPTTTTPSNIDNVHPNHRALLRLQVRLPPPLDRSLSLSSTAWPWVSELLIVESESTLLTKVVLMWFSVQEKTVFVGYACDSHVRGKTAGYHPQSNSRQSGQVTRSSHGSEDNDWSF
jgi:hypothetical protein